MPKPEILSNEAQEGPDGSIFLPAVSLTAREIEKYLHEMYFVRGPLGDLEPAEKIELGARLYARKAELAELALRAT